MLASGYLFTALVVVAYALTFPGAFRSHRPARRGSCKRRPGSSRSGMWDCLRQSSAMQSWEALSRWAAAGPQLDPSRHPRKHLLHHRSGVRCCLVRHVHKDILPDILATDIDGAAAVKIISAVMLTLCATAFVMLLFFRRSVLDLWLLLVSLAWLLSSILINLVGVPLRCRLVCQPHIRDHIGKLCPACAARGINDDLRSAGARRCWRSAANAKAG